MKTGDVVLLWSQSVPHSDELPSICDPAFRPRQGCFPRTDEPCTSSLTAFLPERCDNAPAVVLIPGGAYAFCSVDNEGDDFARWLNLRGIAAFVLRYRTAPEWRHPAMLEDGSRAIRLVRAHAKEWGLDSTKIGAMGSSAGGHLLATILTLGTKGDSDAVDPIERESAIPDFAIFCYPVITMGRFTHLGSKENLLGDKTDDPKLTDLLSCENHVTESAPPCFLWHMANDGSVPMENSLMFAAALHRKGVPVSLHVYPHEGHGLGLGGSRIPPFDDALPWTRELEIWLKESGLLGSQKERRDALT